MQSIKLPPLIIAPKITGMEINLEDVDYAQVALKFEPPSQEEMDACMEKHILEFFNKLTLQ